MRESSGIAAGLSSLPSGGGGITPLGERFQPDLVRGTGSYAVPINCPKGANELQPSLSLTYSTGSGNGPFGFGWRLNVLRIERRTDRGIPNYTGDDTFVIGDAEVLIHVGDNRYRPKADNKFWLIERVNDGWRVRTGDGKTMFFGQSEQSRESDGAKVFAWYLDEERDAAGNSILFSYRRDANRLYLEEIRYSIFSIRITYESRPDVLRNGRSGFERLTALRAHFIEMHCDRLAETLMRTYELTYQQGTNGASLLTEITLSATEDGQTASFPPLTFAYSHPDFTVWGVQELRSFVAPPDLNRKEAQLVDMTGDGLPDIIQSSASGMLLWRNSGDGWLEGPTVLDGIPSTVSLARDNVAFADLDGNGRVELFAVDQPLQIAFETTGKGTFSPDPIIFHDSPNLRLAASNTRLMDVNGDGVTDLITTGRDNFLLYQHKAGLGWQEPQPVMRLSDLEQFPDVTFDDRGIRLADMSGDGLQDIVSLQSGNVCYWPYYGNGKWGQRVEMQHSPQFPEGYRDERIHVVDLDGDGCVDIVYMDYDRTLIWLNQSGLAFSEPVEIPVAPGSNTRILAADILGDGRPGFVWSSTTRSEDSAGYRFLRFDEGRKPYLMTAINNGMGGRFEMEYTTSTVMRLEDQQQGRNWPGELPFVVHVVRKIREHDMIAGRETEMSLHYHDGIYDGPQREFRGFSQVTVEMNGDESVAASRQEFEFFQGDPEHSDFAERDRQRTLAGAMLSTCTFERVDDHYELRNESMQDWDARLEYSSASGHVYFPFTTQITTYEHSPGTSAMRIERTILLDYDAHGNPGKRIRESFFDGEPLDNWIRSEERYTCTNNESEWLIKLPVRMELRDGGGVPFAVKITYYDGPAFVGLPEGQVEQGLVSRVQELKLLESRLPADYVGTRDFSTLGYELLGAGDTRGYYATTLAYSRDARGNIIEQRDPLQHALVIAYDADGVYPVKTRDARGKETGFVFNPKAGEPARTTFADGRVMRQEHDPIGRLAATFETDDADNEQLTKCWVLDLTSTPTSITSIAPQNGGRSRAEFSPGTDFTNLNDVSVSRVYYDGFGQQLLQVSTAPEDTDGTRRFVTTERTLLNPRALKGAGFPPMFTGDLAYQPLPDPGNASVRYRYDVLGNVVETAGPGPVHHRVVRDTHTISHYEGAGAGQFGVTLPPGPPTRVEHFDARGRLFRIEEAKGDGTMIATSYDLAVDGRIDAIRDNAGQPVARYTFAGTAEAIQIAHRDVGARTWYRDAAGHVVERIDSDGSTCFYTYDVSGRLTRIEHTPPGNVIKQLLREIVYDSDAAQPSTGRFLEGRIALVREFGKTLRYSYNHAGKTVREEVTAGGVTLVTAQEYGLQGHLTAIVYPDGHRVEYTLDASGTIKAIPGVVTDISYAEDGVAAGYTLANGVKIELPRDPLSRRLTEVSARKGVDTLRRITYAYDAIGNITGMQDELPGSIEDQTFTYDGLYRLSGFAIHENSAATVRTGAYTYDAMGNIQQFQETEPLTLNYADVAHPGRMTDVTNANGPQTQAVSYNDRGHIRAFGDLASIEYDPLDRVSLVTKTDGTQIRFFYDPQSRRILKEITQGAETRRVHYATGLFERHDTHVIRHIYLGKQLVVSQKVLSGTIEPAYYLTDHHGTVLLATDATGAIIHNQRYSPFGAALNKSDALDRYLGRERDVETGLIHFGARYYAPTLGRFISPDWYVLENPGKAVRMPQGYNLYSYALNNPLVFKDPSGMWFLIDDLIVAAAGFVVGFCSGLIYGLANGQGWGSLLTALETGLTTAAGAWLGWTIAGPLGAFMGGMNGLISGVHGIYDWGSASGWFSFLSDSTWGLIGTSLGNIVHVINLFSPSANYREDLSHRQNRHVYEGGMALKSDFAFTMGNVISNANQGGGSVNTSFIANHEELHVWQNRFFGPLFQAGYVAWAVGGLIVGSVVWLFNTDQNYGSMIETAVYYDNPFEYWAYNNDNNWPPKGANPVIAWG